MPRGRPEPASTDPDPLVDRLYVRNLETIALLAGRLGARVLLVPQVLNTAYFERHDGADQWSPHVENQAMPSLMARFNGLMKSVCDRQGGRCLFVGGVLDVDWQPGDFLDAGHFSREGGARFAEILERGIGTAIAEGPDGGPEGQ